LQVGTVSCSCLRTSASASGTMPSNSADSTWKAGGQHATHHRVSESSGPGCELP
jgi:hypothetical protein